jgi:hypothetical protein
MVPHGFPVLRVDGPPVLSSPDMAVRNARRVCGGGARL